MWTCLNNYFISKLKKKRKMGITKIKGKFNKKKPFQRIARVIK